jgi:hypothetical protein
MLPNVATTFEIADAQSAGGVVKQSCLGTGTFALGGGALGEADAV